MDWDGTTSFSRAGWAGIMTDVCVENLPGHADETDEARRDFAMSEVMSLNGQPSIHQMVHVAKLIQQRGGAPASADDYHAEFQRRLASMVLARLDKVRKQHSRTDELLVPGVRAVLETLRGRGVGLTLASGTVLDELRQEAEILDVARYFDDIHGPADLNDRRFSKRAVIAGILSGKKISGTALLAFGDGPAEIAETKAVGGMAIGVASDEIEHGSGRIDACKRESLLAAGADAVVADFRAMPDFLETILGA